MLIIDLEDILTVRLIPSLWMFLNAQQHENTSAELVSRIRNNARRYVSLFCEVVDNLMPDPTKDISDQDEVIDVILHQRRERNDTLQPGQDGFPDHLLRR
jgi:DNA replication licensing factor MCM7